MTPHIALTCSYSICAGHRLLRPEWTHEENLRAFGMCANSHGHQYTIEVTLAGAVSTDTGMLINGHDVDAIVRQTVIAHLDHKFLNDDVDFFKTHLPTAEWIAVWVYDQLQGAFPAGITVKKVVIYETPHLRAEYPISRG